MSAKSLLLKGITALVGVTAVLFVAATPFHEVHVEKESWSFQGFFGKFDRPQIKRGFQVYKEVCAACHSMRYLSYRNLTALGFSEDEVKAIAATVEVTDKEPNDEGEMFKRPGRPSDRFASPFANEQAARAANGGAYPPDLSLIIKAREGGADYLHALIAAGYQTPPAGVTVPEGKQYNIYFPGNMIAMAPPLAEDAVTFADGTKASVHQMAEDVATFLAWAAEPEMEERKRTGIKVVLFLIVLSGLLYAVKRKVWKGIH